MAVILTWELPLAAFELKIRTVQVFRGKCCLSSDSAFTVFEDVEGADPSAEYHVRFCDHTGNELHRIYNEEVRRYARPDNVCKVSFSLTAEDGSPGSHRIVEVSNENGFSTRVPASYGGKVDLFLVHGRRFKIVVDRDQQALDCVIPNKKEISWDELAAFGSWVPAEQRGSL